MVWSYSRAKSFNNCPLGWWFSYHNKINRDIGNAFADYGSLCHEIIKRQLNFRLINMKPMTNDDMKDDYQKRFYDIKWKFPSQSMKRNYLYDGLNYFTNWDSFEDYKILEVEKFTNFNLCGYKCTGGIDLLMEKDGILYLMDHKSSKPYEGNEMIENTRQLYFYGPAIAQLTGKFPDKIAFNFFRKSKIVVMDWDIEKYKETIGWFKTTIQKIKDCKNFGPKPDQFFCNTLCNHRLTCTEKDVCPKSKPKVVEEFDGYE